MLYPSTPLVLFDIFKFNMTLWQDMTAAATASSPRQDLWMHMARSYSDGKRLREFKLMGSRNTV
jgi:hypothetical protein